MSDPARNAILALLPANARHHIVDAGEIVPLPRGEILYDFDEPLAHIWLPTSGLVSWITTAQESDQVETAVTGREGFVGVQVLLEGDSLPGRSYVLLPGDALRLGVDALRQLQTELPGFQTALHRFVLALITQVTQLSLCNRLHPMEERCARWLLMCHARADGETFSVTHEALAEMLGVRRASVSVALAGLQRAGLITYHMGEMRVLDPVGLEAVACSCVGVMQREYARLLGAPAGSLRTDAMQLV